jgi:hypothetical protein
MRIEKVQSVINPPIVPNKREAFVFSSLPDDVDGVYLAVCQGDEIVLELVNGSLRCGDSTTFSIDLSMVAQPAQCTFAFFAFQNGQKIKELSGPLSELPENIYL